MSDGLFYFVNIQEMLFMPLWGLVIVFVSIFLIFAIIHYISKSKHPLKRSLLSMLIGAATLTAVNLTSGLTGVFLPVSLLSIIVSVVGGVPGVTLLLSLNLFF